MSRATPLPPAASSPRCRLGCFDGPVELRPDGGGYACRACASSSVVVIEATAAALVAHTAAAHPGAPALTCRCCNLHFATERAHTAHVHLVHSEHIAAAPCCCGCCGGGADAGGLCGALAGSRVRVRVVLILLVLAFALALAIGLGVGLGVTAVPASLAALSATASASPAARVRSVVSMPLRLVRPRAHRRPHAHAACPPERPPLLPAPPPPPRPARARPAALRRVMQQPRDHQRDGLAL